MLEIAEGVGLPVQAVTEKIGVFGISGSGKTNTAGVLFIYVGGVWER